MKLPNTEHLLNGCLFFTTAKLDRLLTRWAEEAFGGSGLSPHQAFAVMLVDDRPGITTGELASVLALSPSTLTRFIDKLEALGLVSRSQDGRQTLLQPTAKGHDLHPTLSSGWQSFWLRYTGVLGTDEGNGLAAQLNTVAGNLQLSEGKRE
jgi:DNA-binding MarR family transcriptional regulator